MPGDWQPTKSKARSALLNSTLHASHFTLHKASHFIKLLTLLAFHAIKRKRTETLRSFEPTMRFELMT